VRRIRNWGRTSATGSRDKQEGKPFSEGLERLYVELGALEILAHDGKVDLTKIQVEGVIVKVVKDKFPPPAQK
jgi:soluble cytochrome b562